MAGDNSIQRKPARVRSPSYPSVDLKVALDKAWIFYGHEKRATTPVDVAVSHWGYNSKSSSGQVCLSALKKFGLLTDEGSRGNRHVRLTDLALDILLDQREDSVERDHAVKKAALLPAIHQELWQMYGPDLPSMPTLRTYLIRNKKFNDDIVDDFIKEYRATISFAKLGPEDRISNSADGSPDPDSLGDDPAAAPSTARGSVGEGAKSPEPRLPMQPEVKPPTQPEMRQDVFTLDEGQAVLQWPTQMSEASFADLKDWVELALRKIGRSVRRGSEGRSE